MAYQQPFIQEVREFYGNVFSSCKIHKEYSENNMLFLTKGGGGDLPKWKRMKNSFCATGNVTLPLKVYKHVGLQTVFVQSEEQM